MFSNVFLSLTPLIQAPIISCLDANLIVHVPPAFTPLYAFIPIHSSQIHWLLALAGSASYANPSLLLQVKERVVFLLPYRHSNYSKH